MIQWARAKVQWGTGEQRFNGFNSIKYLQTALLAGRGLCRVVDPAGGGQSRGGSRIRTINLAGKTRGPFNHWEQRRAIATIRDSRWAEVPRMWAFVDRSEIELEADEQRGCTGAMPLVNIAERSPAGGQKTHNSGGRLAAEDRLRARLVLTSKREEGRNCR